jgi:ferredoxin
MLKISTSRLNELFSAIKSKMMLYLPEENDSSSLKKFFFPHVENIAAFKIRKNEISVEDLRVIVEPFALFGLRACDAESLNLLDSVFLSEPVDTFYKARRENGIIITSACFTPEESCFCGAFNIDPLNPAGDITTCAVAHTLYWKPLTERGKNFTNKFTQLFEPVNEKDINEIENAKNKAKEIFNKLPFADLSLDKFLGDVLLEKFHSAKWEKLCGLCIGCGTCTFICPTCHCYDIRDFNTGEQVLRYRCWDSCMYTDFTEMAHGNPRPSRLERFRQRFMHKLIYFPQSNNGVFACTGCGRCVKKCPVSMNIVKVIKEFV